MMMSLVSCSSLYGAVSSHNTKNFNATAKLAPPAKACSLRSRGPCIFGAAAVSARPAVAGRKSLAVANSYAADQHQEGATGSAQVSGKRNIILPVDNTDDSDFALSWALENIYKKGDCLHLLYCIPPYHNQQTFNENQNVPHEEWQKATREAIQNRFQARLSDLGSPYLVYDILEEENISAEMFGVSDARVLKTTGSAATPNMIGDVIIKKAEECDASAVVMASHNKGPLAELFLGSITNYCTHHCSKPVVLLHNMPDPGNGDSKPVGTGRVVAIAVDDSPLSEKSMKWTIDNVYRQGDVIHLLHVVAPLCSDVAVEDGFGDSFEMVTDKVSEKYRDMLESAGIPHEVDLLQEHRIDSIKNDSVRLGSALVGKAEELDASVLVMASHPKGAIDEFLFGSVTNFVTHNANDVPVIVLHP